jgi:DNA-binding NarL/FixJ family response regulator
MEASRCPIRVALVVKRILADAISGSATGYRDLEIHTFAQSPNLDCQRVLECRPHVMVADIDAPNQSVWPLARAFHMHSPSTLLIALASQLLPENITLSRELRTESLVLKSNSLENLLNSVRMVARNQASSMEVDRPGRKLRIDEGESRFSTVQLEILRNLAAGMSVKETAAVLDLTVKSVDGHKTRIMGKLGIRDRAGLVRYAIREGLVTL